MNGKIKSAASIGESFRRCRNSIQSIFLLIFFAAACLAQNPPVTQPTAPSLEKQFFKNVLRDQKKIWTAPFRLRGEDTKWLIPLGAATTALIATDRRTSSEVGRNGSLPVFSRRVSYGGAFYTAGGIAAGFYLIGRATKNPRARETGLLAAEALINSGIVAQSLKLITQRPRPNNGGGRGRFFAGGNSFPSGHAASIWSVATVIAYEYRDRSLVRYGAFAAATAISLSRYSGRNHFLSDVLVGSAVGYGIGRFVYHTHHAQTDHPSEIEPPSKISKLIPTIVPVYNRRNHVYGGTATWNF